MQTTSHTPGLQDGLPLLPLRGLIVFPHMIAPLEVGRPRSLGAIERAMATDRRIVLAAQKDPKTDSPQPNEIFSIGVLAEVKQLHKAPGGPAKVIVEGVERVRIDAFLEQEPHYMVQASALEESAETDSPEVRALMQTTIRQLVRYTEQSKKIPKEILATLDGVDAPGRLADMVAAQLSVEFDERQGLLERISPTDRLERVCVLIAQELEIVGIERRIHGRVRRQMEKAQKEYYLREQMKAIQKELGEKDERTAEVERLEERLEKAKLPKAAKEKVEHELSRLRRMPPTAAESVVVHSYIDWMLSLPWSRSRKETVDVHRAEHILNEDHYGLERVKERILEFLAVRQLAQKAKGPILCLVGPPGVGKTSLAKSVARALDRKFVRFSLGGVRDEAEIRGHRRTYVGAMPGKLIQAMREAGTRNPVILLDEVDKMSMDFRGDPSAALLEVLDPEQNHAFGDHYIEVPFDLSDVFFITTANVLPAIPRPLQDRMEVIHIPGYTEEEKCAIAEQYALPRQLERHGLSSGGLRISSGAIQEVVRSYTREAGVRQMERHLATICRKAALEFAKGNERQVQVTLRNLDRFLGPPKFRHNRAEQEDRVGLATGLAYTDVGGDILSIEVTVVKGKGNLLLTGKLGEVMRESAQAAYSYLRSRHVQLGLNEQFHELVDIHVHVPEGAIPKDGPSAGVAIAVALASAFTGRVVSRHVAMTGEITLRGRVLPIGGVKEKVLAAHRAGIKTVLLPEENAKDLEEIPQQVRKSLEIVMLSHTDEALLRALGPLAEVEREAAAAGEPPRSAPFLPAGNQEFVPWAEESAQ